MATSSDSPFGTRPAVRGGASPHDVDSSSSGGGVGPSQAALDQLQPLQPILAGFNHRNKNQHRVARWWAAFSMLRRHLDKLVDELVQDAAAAAKLEKSKMKKKKLQQTTDSAPRETAAETRALWLRDILVPKCFLAFSQLTADNQFATLGIVLLNVLAEVRSACVGLIGEPIPQAEVAHGQSAGSGFLAPASPSPLSTAGPAISDRTHPVGPGGGGAVVSRKEVARLELLKRQAQGSSNRQLDGADLEPPLLGPDKAEDEDAQTSNVNDDRRRANDDASAATKKGKKRGGHIFGDEKPAERVSAPSDQKGSLPSKKGVQTKDWGQETPPKKKKKKTKKGDEFDNLFKSLM